LRETLNLVAHVDQPVNIKIWYRKMICIVMAVKKTRGCNRTFCNSN